MDEELEGQGSETGSETETVANETHVEEGSQEGSSGLNPAWNDLLGVVPSQLHSQVTPFLQNWDKNYQDGINKVHSQYEAYKPFVENKIDAEDINYALQVMQAINDNPVEVAKKLQEFAGVPSEEQQNTDEQGQFDETEQNELLNHPQFKEMKQMVETMAQLLVQQNQTSQQIEEDKALAKELSTLKETLGEYDEEWVLTRAYAKPDIPLEDHVKAYLDHERSILEKARKPGPKVLNGGGGAPNSQLDVKKLDDKGRRELVQQMLQANAQQNQ